MRRQFLIAALIFAGARCAWSAETVRPVTLPDLSIFPQLFVGVPLVLEQVELEWRIVKEFDYYCLGISVKEGRGAAGRWSAGSTSPPSEQAAGHRRCRGAARPGAARQDGARHGLPGEDLVHGGAGG